MCTTGALRLAGRDYLLFKNKDFGRESFEDRLVLDADVFGVCGVSTWAGTDPDLDDFSGFSIGANRHGLLVCDSNVRTVPDHDNYDRLVEIALREGRDVASAIDAVRATTSDHPHGWANLVLIDDSGIVGVDVRDQVIEVDRAADRIVRTNHHVLLGATAGDDDTTTTEKRLESARTRIAEASSLEDVFSLQASHDDGGTGVCNHSIYETVYSYVLRRRGETTTLIVTKGHPCERSERVELTVPLGSAWTAERAEAFREAYPSTRAAVAPVGFD